MPKTKLLTAGGQAVIEGVMMRSNKYIAVAVRKPNGRISLKREKYHSLTHRIKVLGWPFIRGMIILFEVLVKGIKALSYSATESIEEEEEKISVLQIVLSILFAIAFAILLFKAIPLIITQALHTKITAVKEHYVLYNLIDGLLKVLILTIYILLISLMKDVRILFQYHGAEHKAVNCYEERKKLTLSNCRKYTTTHPRCGTSFILVVLLLSIIFYMFIPASFSFGMKLLLRIALLPIIAAVSYEILRLGDKYKEKTIFKILTYPGVFMQKLTTREPDDKQISVALRALKAVI